MELLRPRELAEFAIKNYPVIGIPILLAALTACGAEIISADSEYSIKNLQPGQQVTVCDCEVAIETSVNRRSTPQIFPPNIARAVGNNILYADTEEVVKYPLIKTYPIAEYRASTETDWMSFISPKNGKDVYIVINGETIDRLRGLDPHLFKKAVIEKVEITKQNGVETVSVTARKNGFLIPVSQIQIPK